MAYSKYLALFAVLGTTAACASAPPVRPTVAPAPAAPVKLTPAEIAKRADPSIVRIQTDSGLGTGFVVNDKGDIATNLHVIDGAHEIEVVLENGHKIAAKTVTIPESKDAKDKVDLAIVHIDDTTLRPLVFGSDPAVGEHVTAIGNPVGLDRTVSDGLLSSIREEEGTTYLQISAPISHGSSGGPVFNDRGEVIGVTTAMRPDAQNINWALPIAKLKALIASSAKPVSVQDFEKASARAQTDRWVKNQTERCMRGAPEACITLGNDYYKGRGVTRDDAKAAELYTRACDMGSAVGCTCVGIMNFEGRGRPKDMKHAAELFEKSCSRGDNDACAWAGKVYADGEGISRNAKSALRYYEKACDGGYGWACQESASMHEKSKRRDRAMALYQRACDGKLASACTKLAGLVRDESRSASMFRRACDGGDFEGCGHLGAALVDGKGISTNVTQGMEYLRYSCRQGSSWSCDKLKALGDKT